MMLPLLREPAGWRNHQKMFFPGMLKRELGGLPVQRLSDCFLEPWRRLKALGLQGVNKAQLLPSRSSRSNKFTHSSSKYLLNIENVPGR